MESPIQITNLPTYNTNHHGKSFLNCPGEPQPPEMVFKFFFGPSDVSADNCAPFRQITPEEFSREPGIRFWWIGHATCLFQLGDIFILTDPVFTTYASPVAGIAKRAVPPACTIDQLPKISYCIISHNHYDHLDHPSIMDLYKRFPDIIFFVGLRMSELIGKWGIPQKSIVEFDWRQKAELLPPNSTNSNPIILTCMPAHHYSNRKGYDGGKYLWISFLIEYSNILIYFPGDTSIGPHFSEVSTVAGRPIDFVSMPVGPTEPFQIMKAVHVDPEQARDMSEILRAKVVVPIHWGVFPLGKLPDISDIEAIKIAFHNINKDDILKRVKVGGSLEYNQSSNQFEVKEGSLDDFLIV